MPGTWVMAPEVGLLWTPGYWGWGGNAYMWNHGYLGSAGRLLRWGQLRLWLWGFRLSGRTLAGRTVLLQPFGDVNVTSIHNVYNQTVIDNMRMNDVMNNGGTGGITACRARQKAAAHQQHRPPTASNPACAGCPDQPRTPGVREPRGVGYRLTVKPAEFRRSWGGSGRAGGSTLQGCCRRE